MKLNLTLTLVCAALLSGSLLQTTRAAIEAPKPKLTDAETTPHLKAPAKAASADTWTIEITPAPGLNSYATKQVQVPLHQTQPASAENAADTIVIVPRDIPQIPEQECEHCTAPHRSIQRMAAQYGFRSWPLATNGYFANLQSVPALYMYSDLIRSNWFGSPYHGHSFYYNGYRPSFRFGSLQYRGFGNYDRMYNPRVIPFGYQYSGARDYYRILALTSMLANLP
ncbi:hypothetical protein V6x_36610 [Gimesia chilikensis]|uniref:DUF3300 domain-containing protein n=1 Tax=Gimesia chilikensis TaxID=2605989 RepID=A0A517WF97_9PLAN|nr:hypothetical protein [Gimesia chilikensis]QDU03938.1 hypothetical protein V6x_36610 [Gimesia chilikensis]